MRNTLTLILALGAFTAHAQEWSMTDIRERNVTKEEIFSRMDGKTITSSSICANRALMWLYEFKKNFNVDGSKIFLFYTGVRSGRTLRRWWYHVAPIINDAGTEFVMDPAFTRGPLLVDHWINKFVGNNNCYEIKEDDRDLAELMYKGQQFPKETYRGKYDCYYVKVPAGFWYPRSVADSVMGKNVSPEISENNVYSACLEASTHPIGGLLRLGKEKCKKFVGRE